MTAEAIREGANFGMIYAASNNLALANKTIAKLQAENAMLKTSLHNLDNQSFGHETNGLALRAVIASLLIELQKSDPANLLLNKEHRDDVMDKAYDHFFAKTKNESYVVREEKFSIRRGEAFGEEGAKRSGPSKEHIETRVLKQKKTS